MPEDKAVRRALRRESGAPTPAAFDLLSTQIGLDCAGAVQFATDPDVLAEPHVPQSRDYVASTTVTNAVTKIARRQPDETMFPFGADRFSLAGFQHKLALGWDPETANWYLPSLNEPSTHIIKPIRQRGPKSDDSSPWPNLGVVEHLTMATAEQCGLITPPTSLEQFGEATAIVILRYDRMRHGDVVLRLHQEDLCQALDIHPKQKYEVDGGPTAQSTARLLQHIGNDSAERFLEALIFNWVIVGDDAHAKNYSILLLGPATAILAPVYDLTSRLPYEPLDAIGRVDLAMRAGASNHYVDDFDNAEAWADTADICGVPQADALASMERIVGSVQAGSLDAYHALEPEFANLPEARKYVEAVESRANTATRVAGQLADLVHSRGPTHRL